MMIKKRKNVKRAVAQESTYTSSKENQLLSDICMLAGVAVTLIYLSYIAS